ncbi:MAG TPA: tetratricopeptide repeat protein [Herbaspirillum sp.]|jgi:tetratricopeptide (TPR) repeat protein
MEILNALEHHQAGRLAEAIDIYQAILSAQPDNPDALHLMGNAAGQLGDVDFSIQLITRACALAPLNTTYLLSLATAYRVKTQFEQALICYARILEIDPKAVAAHYGVGNTLQNLGRPREAVHSFASALALNPDFIEARYNLANLQKSLGNLAEAVQHYQLAVALKPDFADAYHNMGSALHALGQFDQALASYEQALWCDLPETHNNMGAVYFDQGRFARALASYRLAIVARPDYAEAYNNVGNTLRKMGEFDAAAAALRKAVELAPAYCVAHLNLGDLLLECELLDDAAQCYENAIAIAIASATAPSLAQAHFQLGIVRSKQNRLQSAMDCFEQALAHRPGHADALYNLGLVNARRGQAAQAECAYRLALDADPDYLDAHINLSAILLQDGRAAEAKRHLDLAYSQKNLFERHAPGADKTVLILFDAGQGNLNLTHLFDENANSTIDWMIEYAPDDQAARLPHHDLVFNAMGDADLTGDTARPLARFLQSCDKPLLNHPDRVARTARHKLPALLAGIDKLLVPAVWRFADAAAWLPAMEQHLPLLTRPVHTQGGIGLELATDAAQLAQCRAMQSTPLYAACYVDYRSADAFFRKYRVIFIDREPYPYHLAISPHWMVHYDTADMEDFPWKLEEERRFLENPEAVLGAAGMQALRAIGAAMDLDYAGIDFSLMPDARLLVFEANPTMLVHPEIVDGPLGHKNPYIRRIYAAFENLLKRAAASSTAGTA